MFRIAVYEEHADIRRMIHSCLEQFSFHSNFIYDVLWMKSMPSEQQQNTYLAAVHLGIISLDLPCGRELAEALYDRNGNCRIMFISSKPRDVVCLLHTRPISFCLCKNACDDMARFYDKLEAIFRDMYAVSEFCRIETKNGVYLMSARDILYIQSDLKYVSIHPLKGEPISIFRKLSDMRNDLDGRFIRVHQSFLVNRDHILSVDKRLHMLTITGGEQLPISASRYEAVLQSLKCDNRKINTALSRSNSALNLADAD